MLALLAATLGPAAASWFGVIATGDLVLDSLGDPSLPLGGESGRRIDARWLSLPRLEALHAFALRASGMSRAGT